MAKTKAAEFSPGHLELISPETAKPDVKEFELDREVSRIFTFYGEVRAVTKTMGPFTGKLFHGSGEQIATLDDVTVTATRGTSPQGQSFIVMTLEYLVTSHGWRTGTGSSGEPWGLRQEVRCQNSAGGTMYVVGFDPFEMLCGDRRRYDRRSTSLLLDCGVCQLDRPDLLRALSMRRTPERLARVCRAPPLRVVAVCQPGGRDGVV
jgi:hypothetical protein